MAVIPVNYTVLAFGRTKYRPVFHGTYFYYFYDSVNDLTTDESKRREIVEAMASNYYHTEWKHAQEWSWPLQFKLWYESFNNESVELGTYTVQLSQIPTFTVSEGEES